MRVLRLLAVSGILVTSAVVVLNVCTENPDPDKRAIVAMGVGLILIWCVTGGLTMRYLRPPLRPMVSDTSDGLETPLRAALHRNGPGRRSDYDFADERRAILWRRDLGCKDHRILAVILPLVFIVPLKVSLLMAFASRTIRRFRSTASEDSLEKIPKPD